MPTQDFHFVNRLGERLSGSLEMPQGILRGWALIAHCFTCGKNSLATVRISRTLAAAGIGVLRFDFSGIGESEGDFSQSTFSLNIDDVLCAAEAMAAAGMPPRLLIGHSLGGAAVLAAAGRVATTRAIATIAAPFDVAHVMQHLDRADLESMEAGGTKLARITGRGISVGRAFVRDAQGHDQAARIAGLRKPLLLLHSPRDQVVGIDNVARIYLAARHPKSFLSLDDADHLLSGPGDAEHAARLISAWVARYLPEGPIPALAASA